MNFELICWCINLHQKVWYKSEKAFGLWPEWHYTTREIGGWIHIITSPSLYHWWGVCEVYASHGTQDFSEAICEKWSKTNRKAKSVWEEKASYGPYQNTIEAERKQKHSTWSRKEVKTRQTDRIWTMYTCTLTRPTSRSESRKPGARDIPLKQYWSRKRVSCTKLTQRNTYVTCLLIWAATAFCRQRKQWIRHTVDLSLKRSDFICYARSWIIQSNLICQIYPILSTIYFGMTGQTLRLTVARFMQTCRPPWHPGFVLWWLIVMLTPPRTAHWR